MSQMADFLKDERGQDLIEYAILISFVSIAVVGLFMGAGTNVKEAWVVTNNRLTQANNGSS
jgi:Flp pilus assembly pilin Flp